MRLWCCMRMRTKTQQVGVTKGLLVVSSRMKLLVFSWLLPLLLVRGALSRNKYCVIGAGPAGE